MREICIDNMVYIANRDNRIDMLAPKKEIARKICYKMKKAVRYLNQNEIISKRIELYKIKLGSKIEYFVADKDLLPNEEKVGRKLYFNKCIALEVCNILNRLNDNALNSCTELMEMYEKEVSEMYEKIEMLQNIDENKFAKAKIIDYKKRNEKLKNMLRVSIEQYEKAVILQNK